MNNRIEQNHRRVKRRTRPMPGFKSLASTALILDGVELVNMIRKGQMLVTESQIPSLADPFNPAGRVNHGSDGAIYPTEEFATELLSPVPYMAGRGDHDDRSGGVAVVYD
jgi:hypothetical protein